MGKEFKFAIGDAVVFKPRLREVLDAIHIQQQDGKAAWLGRIPSMEGFTSIVGSQLVETCAGGTQYHYGLLFTAARDGVKSVNEFYLESADVAREQIKDALAQYARKEQ